MRLRSATQPGYQRGWGVPHNCYQRGQNMLHATAAYALQWSSLGKCANDWTMRWRWKRAMESPSLCGGLWDSFVSLSARDPCGSTHVPPTAPDQRCFTLSCYFRDVQIPALAAGCGGWEDWCQDPPSKVYQRCQHCKQVQNVQCHSSNLRHEEEEMAELEDTPKECPCWKWKEGKAMVAKPLKDPHWEAFTKESEVIRAARWDLLQDPPA